MSTEVTAGTSDGRASKPRRVEHPSESERAAKGKAARAEVPRSAHAAWEPQQDRTSPLELLEQQAQTRVPELVPIRYGRMLVSPFTFYRGAAYLMASDLAGAPRTRLTVQLCGDAHLSNFGAFAAPDRRLVFSINDFDETHPGPFEWDVKRLAASFAVAGRDRGFDDKQREAVNLAVGRSYREAISRYAGMRNLDLWYSRIDVDDLLAELSSFATAKEQKRADKNLAKTKTKDSLKAFAKLTEIVDGEPRIVGDPPVVTPIEDLLGDRSDEFDAFLHGVIRSYRRTLAGDRRRLLERYRYVHAARKVVGVGSVGTRAFIMLMLGRDDNDPLFLQFKEAEAVSARAVPRQERVRKPRPACGRRAAPDPGRERHHARLHQRGGHRRREARLLRPPALGREGLGSGRVHGADDDAHVRNRLRG